MGKTSVCGKRLSLILGRIGAIAFIALGASPSQAAELQPGPTLTLLSDRNTQQGTKQLATEDASAEDLMPSSASLQSDGLSDLPILEPSILLDQPVSVPAIAPPAAPIAPTAVTPPTTPSVSVPPLMPPVVTAPPAEVTLPIESIDPVEPIETAETTEPVEAVEMISPADAVEVIETAETIDTGAAVDPTETATAPVQNEPEIPLEPPFLGDLAERTAPPTVTVPELSPDPTTIPALSAPTAASPTETLASGSSPALLPPALLPAVVEPAAAELAPAAVPTIRPSYTNRWPDPIPFGQPLPNN